MTPKTNRVPTDKNARRYPAYKFDYKQNQPPFHVQVLFSIINQWAYAGCFSPFVRSSPIFLSILCACACVCVSSKGWRSQALLHCEHSHKRSPRIYKSAARMKQARSALRTSACVRECTMCACCEQRLYCQITGVNYDIYNVVEHTLT